MAERNSAPPDYKAREIQVLLLVIPSLQQHIQAFQLPGNRKDQQSWFRQQFRVMDAIPEPGNRQLCFTLVGSSSSQGSSSLPWLANIPLEAWMQAGKADSRRMKLRNSSELLLRSYHGLVSFLSPSSESAKPTPRSHPWHWDIPEALSIPDPHQSGSWELQHSLICLCPAAVTKCHSQAAIFITEKL